MQLQIAFQWDWFCPLLISWLVQDWSSVSVCGSSHVLFTRFTLYIVTITLIIIFLGQERLLKHLGQGCPLTNMIRLIKLKRLVHGRLQKKITCLLDSLTGSLSEFQSYGRLIDCITKYSLLNKICRLA